MATTTTQDDRAIGGLWSSTPQPLPFAPEVEVRAFLLERAGGNLLIYSTGTLEAEAAHLRARGVERQYLNHWHEAMLGLAPAGLGARLVHHEAEAPEVARRGGHGVTFSRRHRLGDDFEAIPIPGHTPGATAYLWDTGGHRLLFTGDSVYLRGDEWVAAVLDSSDRERYVESLQLLRDLDFDVLVPWAASVGGPHLSVVDAAGRRARLDAIIERLQRGEDH